MAESTCVKCGGNTFEMVTRDVPGAKYKLRFVQCGACGGVVGTSEYTYLIDLIYQQNTVLARIAERLNLDDVG